jgi:hypothetical protein
MRARDLAVPCPAVPLTDPAAEAVTVDVLADRAVQT